MPWIGAGVGVVAIVIAAIVFWPSDGTSTDTSVAAGSSTSSSSSVTTEPGTPPTIVPIAAQESVAASEVDLVVEATDPDGDALTFAASGLPAGVTLDGEGRITGIVAAEPGIYDVTVTVSDGKNEATETFSWAVTASPPPSAPVIETVVTWIDPGGNEFELPIADLEGLVITETASLEIVFAATDPQGLPLTFDVTGVPEGLTMEPRGRLIGAAAGGTAQAEPYLVAIDVTNGASWADVSFTWHVAFGPGATCEAIAVDFTYADAVAYWLRESEPAALDLDGNGLPCVSAFIALDRLAEIDDFYGPADFGAGLSCADLAGVPYETVVAYWLRRGQPADLDEGFGLPCDISRPDEAFDFFQFEAMP